MMKLSLLALVFAAACGKGETAAGGGGGGESGGPAKLPDGAVEEANAAVPADLKGKLEFMSGSFSERKTKLLVPLPKGWVMSDVIPGSYKAPDGLGFRTKLNVGSSCDGACEAKDWAAASDNELFKQFSGGSFTVDADQKSDGQRVLLATDGEGAKFVAVAKWKQGESRYYSCSVTLDKEAVGAASAFEKACRALTPEW